MASAAAVGARVTTSAGLRASPSTSPQATPAPASGDAAAATALSFFFFFLVCVPLAAAATASAAAASHAARRSAHLPPRWSFSSTQPRGSTATASTVRVMVSDDRVSTDARAAKAPAGVSGLCGGVSSGR